MEDRIHDRLQELSDIISTKHSSYHIFTSRKTSFDTKFETPLELNPNRSYEVALQYFSTSNFLTNITAENNRFVYSNDGGKNWLTITLESGAYEISILNSEIRRQITQSSGATSQVNAIEIGIILSTFKSFINITSPTLQVDFTKTKTFRDMLGFKSQILKQGYNISNDTVQITTTSAILIHCDIVSGSYINGKEGNVLYSFPAYTVPVGAKINVMVASLLYLPINRTTISNIYFQITDEEGRVLDFKNEEISIAIHVRQV